MIGPKLCKAAKQPWIAPRHVLTRLMSTNQSISEASEALEHISHEEGEAATVKVEKAKTASFRPRLDRERHNCMTYGIATGSRVDKINSMLYASYHPHEPISEALGLFKGEFTIPDADLRVDFMIRKNLSLFIYDETGREVGVCVNSLYTKEDFFDHLDVDAVVDPAYKPYLAVHKKLRAMNMNLFDELKTEKLFNIAMIGVDPAARGKGIATDLIRRSVLLAGTLGYTGIMTEATGSFSQRAFATIGMMDVNSVAYKDFEFEGQKVFRNMAKQHPEITMMKKKFFQSCLKHIM